ncbi:hypothetical protein NUBL17188_46620 [Klebsiella pneumoniae]|nr:hypothetical protein NUBL17188_46620 [Klebsiella pneumoniae]
MAQQDVTVFTKDERNVRQIDQEKKGRERREKINRPATSRECLRPQMADLNRRRWLRAKRFQQFR